MEVDGNQIMGPVDDHAISQGYVTVRFPDFWVNARQNGVYVALPCDGDGRNVEYFDRHPFEFANAGRWTGKRCAAAAARAEAKASAWPRLSPAGPPQKASPQGRPSSPDPLLKPPVSPKALVFVEYPELSWAPGSPFRENGPGHRARAGRRSTDWPLVFAMLRHSPMEFAGHAVWLSPDDHRRVEVQRTALWPIGRRRPL